MQTDGYQGCGVYHCLTAARSASDRIKTLIRGALQQRGSLSSRTVAVCQIPRLTGAWKPGGAAAEGQPVSASPPRPLTRRPWRRRLPMVLSYETRSRAFPLSNTRQPSTITERQRPRLRRPLLLLGLPPAADLVDPQRRPAGWANLQPQLSRTVKMRSLIGRSLVASPSS